MKSLKAFPFKIYCLMLALIVALRFVMADGLPTGYDPNACRGVFVVMASGGNCRLWSATSPSSGSAFEWGGCSDLKILAVGVATGCTINDDGTTNGAPPIFGSIAIQGVDKIACQTNDESSGLGFHFWCLTAPQSNGTITVSVQGVSGMMDVGNGCANDDKSISGTISVNVDGGDCGGGSGGSGQNCTTCGGNTGSGGLGSGCCGNSSVDFRVGLGRIGTGVSAGYIGLKIDQPPASGLSLADRSLLVVPFNGITGIRTIPDNTGSVSQVNVPDGLIVVVPINSLSYRLDCYHNGTFKDNADKTAYVITGLAFTSWTITDMGNNQLQIINDGRTYTYQYTSLNNRWVLTNPDQSSITTWRTGDPNGQYVFYKNVNAADGTLLSSSQKTYVFQNSVHKGLLISDVSGSGGATVSSQSDYVGAGTNGQFCVQRRINSDGSWNYYVYDSSSRLTIEYGSFGTVAAPSLGWDQSAIGCTKTVYVYSDTVATEHLADPIEIWKYLPDAQKNWQLVSCTKHSYGGILDNAYSPVASTTTEYPNPSGDGANLGAYLQTTARTYALNNPNCGKLLSTVRPDGTASVYTYSADGLTTTQRDGYLSNLNTAPETPGALSNVIRTETTVDDIGTVILVKVVAELGSGEAVLSYNKTVYDDPQKRTDYVTTDLASRQTHYLFNDCCSSLNTVIDSDNVTTAYNYDPLTKRLVSQVKTLGAKPGITNAFGYDGSGKKIWSARYGTVNGVGSTNNFVRRAYDLAGRVVLETNALNGITSTSYGTVNGGITTTAIYPDGGVRTETYYPDGRLQRVSGTAVHGVRYVYGIEADGSSYREFTQEIKLDANGADREWTKTYGDGLGRTVKVSKLTQQGTATTQYFYNSKGQLWKETDPDQVTKIYVYSNIGDREYTVLACGPLARAATEAQAATFDSLSGQLQPVDRVTRVTRSYLSGNPGTTKVDNYIWDDATSPGYLLSSVETTSDGYSTQTTTWPDWDFDNSSNERFLIRTVGETRYVQEYTLGGKTTTSTFVNGQLVQKSVTDYNGQPVSTTSYQYDGHGRLWKSTDARNGTTTYAYNDADQTTCVTPPSAGLGAGALSTFTGYDNMLRVVSVTNADGSVVGNDYYQTGELRGTHGSRVYPVGYTYDYAGRLAQMTTWSSYTGLQNPRITSWTYDAGGLLQNKYSPDSSSGLPETTGVSYAYTLGGRLNTRTWKRGVSATYTYGFNDAATTGNMHGDLVRVTYSDATTLGLTNGYDRVGRLNQVATTTNGAIRSITSISHDDYGSALAESYAAGVLNNGFPLDGFSVNWHYDNRFIRRSYMGLSQGSPTGTLKTCMYYDYDLAERLLDQSDATRAATNYYVANSSLIGKVDYALNYQNPVLTITNQFDFLNRRLSGRVVTPQGAELWSFGYEYNLAGQRIRNTLVDGSYWIYQYDNLGQVISGKRYWADGSFVPGQQFEYSMDEIGNRISTKAGGDQNGANLRPATYTRTMANTYSSRSVPSAVDIMGVAYANTSVSVNSTQVSYRKGEFFRQELTVANSSPIWQNLSVTSGSATTAGHLYVPASSENFSYDADGNLLDDSRWHYTWDGENRLVRMVAKISAAVPQCIAFEYDWKGRLIHKQVWNTTLGTGAADWDQKLLYDGWNLIGLFDSRYTNPTYFGWGLDLSGSLEGAGGVGGLLWVYGPTGFTASATTHLVTSDGNGNVSFLFNPADGSTTKYEYGPFGELLRATGPMAKANPFRFSTKFTDDETELVYYGYRYYNPSTGRWLSRDPLNEKGFKVSTGKNRTFVRSEERNLYCFVLNDPVDNADRLGLTLIPPSDDPIVIPPDDPPSDPNLPPVLVPGVFQVAGTTIDSWIGGVLQTIGVDHVDITYHGSVVYVGKGGDQKRFGKDYVLTNHKYDLAQTYSGSLKWGKKTPCKCSTEADILECLQKRVRSGRNCQGDVQNAIGECCLTGFRNLVSTISQ